MTREQRLKNLEKARKVRAKNRAKAERKAQKEKDKRLEEYRKRLPGLYDEYSKALAIVNRYVDKPKFSEAEQRAYAKLESLGNEIRGLARVLR